MPIDCCNDSLHCRSVSGADFILSLDVPGKTELGNMAALLLRHIACNPVLPFFHLSPQWKKGLNYSEAIVENIPKERPILKIGPLFRYVLLTEI